MDKFVKATSSNLPRVDIFMVHELIKRDDRFNIAEVAGVKATSSTRESYGDNAIGYVELKKEGEICTVRARICPEHKVRSKAYTVEAVINEVNENILDVCCKDCAAGAGGCKHALALLMWLNRRSEDPSPTEVTSYWKKPRLSDVGTGIKFVEVKEFGKESSSSTVKHSDSDTNNFLVELLDEGRKEKINCHLTRSTLNFKDNFSDLSLHRLTLTFQSQGGVDFKEFLNFAKQHINVDLCKQAEEATRGQTKCPLWFELRYARITASKIHEASRCKSEAGTLVESIIGAYKMKPSAGTLRGQNLEKKVLRVVEEKFGVKFRECGLFLMAEHPIFGASPDALGKDYVVEVKCPISKKTMTNYLNNSEITKKYKAQVQLQMMASGMKKALFCVAEPDFEETKNVNVIWANYKKEYINTLIEHCLDFYENNIFRKICN